MTDYYETLEGRGPQWAVSPRRACGPNGGATKIKEDHEMRTYTSIHDREEALRLALSRVIGQHYLGKLARKTLDNCNLDWSQYWPIVDADGKITGELSGGEEGYYNVDDLAMIAEEDIPSHILGKIHQEEADGTFDGYVTLPL